MFRFSKGDRSGGFAVKIWCFIKGPLLSKLSLMRIIRCHFMKRGDQHDGCRAGDNMRFLHTLKKISFREKDNI